MLILSEQGLNCDCRHCYYLNIENWDSNYVHEFAYWKIEVPV